MMNVRFILLMRHAKRAREETAAKPETANSFNLAAFLGQLAQRSGTEGASVLSAEGRAETRSVAKSLKEFVEESEYLKLAGILFAKSVEAEETATIFRRVYESDPPRDMIELPLLAPRTQTLELKKGNAQRLGKRLKCHVLSKAAKLVDRGRLGNAVLVVGHQPSLSWLAHATVGEAHPLAHSEILCLDLKGHVPPTLSWSISASDDTTLQELREKIKSKMALASMLGGFITAGIGFLLPMLADNEKIKALGVQAPVVFLAAGCLLLAVILYLLTMFSYDALLMPTRLWTEAPSVTTHRPAWIVARPPSGSRWILYQNMIRIWQWQFMPATFLTLSGVFMLWSGVFWGTSCISHSDERIWSGVSRLLSLSVPVGAALIVLGAKAKNIVGGWRDGWEGFCSCPGLTMKFRYLCGPWLGSED